MLSRSWFPPLALVSVLFATLSALGQESAVKGNLSVLVSDATGALVSGAKITANGPIGTQSLDTDQSGNVLFPLIIPGSYSVKVEKAGFKTVELKSVEVVTNKTASVHITLEPGAVTEVVEVSGSAVTVDTSSSAVSANLNDTFYSKIPVGRSIADIFYISAGVAPGGLTGNANPSISGGSGLENLYVADGVNITDSSFGGLGVFSRNYGPLGSGINLTFVKEVQVKTGGYEPQYGKATGGVVQIVTKSGSRAYHGAISGYFAPQEFEASRKQPDDTPGVLNLYGKTLHYANYDVSAEIGGFVPGLREKFFFFGSVNPSFQKEYILAAANSGLFPLGQMELRTNTMNYAFKATYKINDKHQVESSLFGDPAHTSRGPQRYTVEDNTSGFSKFELGTRNWVMRYNGSLTPTWLVNASFTWAKNRFDEILPSLTANTYRIQDLTQTAVPAIPGQRGAFYAQGLGFIETYKADNFGFDLDTLKTFQKAGTHTITVGYRMERPFYDDKKDRSGPRFVIPNTNATGDNLGLPPDAIGAMTNASFFLQLAPDSCTLCPYWPVPGIAGPGPNGTSRVFLNQDRGEFGPSAVSTHGVYQAAYIQDAWVPNHHLTVNAGVRWEQHLIEGVLTHYTFTDNWSPRVGVIFDPKGDRKTKLYFNFGRYDYAMPLDAAIRSLSSELDFIGATWAPDSTIVNGQPIATKGALGTVVPDLNSNHLLNNAGIDPNTGNCKNAPPAPCGLSGSPFFSAQAAAEGIAPGTKMLYEDEYVGGVEHEFKHGIVMSARYLDRRMKRVVEDMSGIPAEAAAAGLPQTYLIGNPVASLDLFTNPISVVNPTDPATQCNGGSVVTVTNTFGKTLGTVCYSNSSVAGAAIPDGKPDGFVNPKRVYQAVELEVNKGFSQNWQMRVNYRYAKLFGNYEGAFRNDNGQADPGITSLFDFVPGDFHLIDGQFIPGTLNTDRRHIGNLYVSYALSKSRLHNLTLGTGFRVQSGTPLTPTQGHPAYINAGEVPEGRGILGRSPTTYSIDLHSDYPVKLSERFLLRFGADLFNVTNARDVVYINQNQDLSFGVPNADFLKPGNQNDLLQGRRNTFQRPFYMRAMVRFEF